ncbi:putative RVS161-protein [Leucosporidium creatinivorum]|uniref:Putative RVS161-protein n=1 Tax=Leucosporidium creatinivorum TaxID=106004 RepID=A0A1Y2D3Z8_9BASI|nr:putative RVS161-protein [Leucosporidium creatinivorum]
MSWNGLKKAVNRAGTNVMMKTGQVERTDDTVFKREEAMYRTMEKNTSALHKEAKAYLDAVRSVSASSTRIATTIDLFFGSDAGEQAMSANAYKRAVEEWEGSVSRSIDAPYRATVLEPVGKLCSYFPEINNAISKRHKKLLDYDAARSKARKLGEKPPNDPSKLPLAEQEAETAEEIYKIIDEQLRNDLPQILDLRVPYLDPSFECMIRMQSHFATDGYEKLGGVQRYFAEGVREDYAAGGLDAQVEGCLQEMRELTICGLSA